ncbi:FxsC C-terminal domain-containing protein [Frankia sp. EI5c]|uniref:FxsC protein n=1 Tax=Frankia sp. EI5c TaxID=683316 RepID=UPI0007C221E6|nr:FxsC protein [Frankia sp. EI5c]OAA23235.1 FxsC C-terminal domain-containing protein [Frankia sp. EI5c]
MNAAAITVSAGAGEPARLSPPPLFVLHLAPEDDTLYARSLFDEIQREIFDRRGREQANIGSLAPVGDRGETPGPVGFVAASAQVQTCHALVVLYSQGYLQDQACLLEWTLFRERVRWHNRLTGRATPALIGVRWALRKGVEDASIVGRDVLWGDFGPGYEDGGGLRLARRDPGSSGWRRLVSAIAGRVTRAADDPPPRIPERTLPRLSLPHGAPRVERTAVPAQVAPAGTGADLPRGPVLPGQLWRPGPRQPGQRQPGPRQPEQRQPGPRQPGQPPAGPPQPADQSSAPAATEFVGAEVCLIVAVSPPGELPARRTDRQCYGAFPGEWRPFRTEDPRSAVEIIRQAVAGITLPGSERTGVDVHLLSAETMNRLDGGSADAQILILLADPWSVLAEPALSLLRRFGEWQRRRVGAGGVLFVFAATDRETLQHAERLRGEVSPAITLRPHRPRGERLPEEVRTADQLAHATTRLVTRTRNGLLAQSGGGLPPGRPGRAEEGK